MSTYASLNDLASAIEEHLAHHDMPVLIKSEKVDGGYTFSDFDDAPLGVTEPEGYKGDEDLYYWGTNTPTLQALIVGDYELRLMHPSERASAGLILGHLESALDDGPRVLGCVVVTFDEGPDEESSIEWAWVTSL